MNHKLFLLFAVLPVLFSSPVLAKEFKDSPGASHLTMQMDKKPLPEIAEEVLKQTGYRVVFDEKWNSLTVTGSYADVSIDEFFRRAFRKQNTSLLVNDKEKVIAVRFFGDKSFADLLANVALGKGGDIPEDIAVLHNEQQAELQAYLRDPESVDPMSGMKLVDIRGMHQQQLEELEQMKSNPETVDPISGSTIGEIERLHKQQQGEAEEWKSNPETVEPSTGMSIAEISRLHQEQRAELEQMLKDPETIDPISGMKLSDIWQQAKNPQ